MVWMLCDGSRDLMSIAEEIASTSNMTTTDVLPDVRETVSQFRTLGLLDEAKA